MASTHVKHHSITSDSNHSAVGHGSLSPPTAPSLTPPPYSAEQRSPAEEVASGPPDLSARLTNLSLNGQTPFPTADQCIAHLKLLEAFQRLREDIASQDGLFDITPPTGNLARDNAAQARVREKTWAVFVARAVDRFERWWTECLPPMFDGLSYDRLRGGHFLLNALEHTRFKLDAKAITFSTETMPPLDVLMVWHSYLLNPRCFFEDCWRYGKLDLYVTGLPWNAIDACIDNVTFQYVTTAAAESHFEEKTGRSWRNLDDQGSKNFPCGKCSRAMSVPWTAGSGYTTDSSEFAAGFGYADTQFAARCTHCKTYYNHDVLRALKFREDVRLLRMEDCPLPGTITSVTGQLPVCRFETDVLQCYFPNWLVEAARFYFLEGAWMIYSNPDSSPSMEKIRDGLEAALKDINVLKELKCSKLYRPGKRKLKEKFALRRMLSRYWFNSSPFALDLVGAVIRQGSFVEKMHNIDWLHSPALKSTMDHLIKKYSRFFAIMAKHPDKVAVPTLDVDLAWHTHQLAPRAYYLYSDKHAHSLIDHDDKIEENKLSDAFAWTSKTYQRKYGEPYSACTCWYCEAIRETTTSSLSTIFRTRNYEASRILHDAPDPATSDPLKSPHISAHNAVHDQDSEARARVNAAKLDKAYHQACARARKDGRKEPERDQYFHAYAWGYPVVYPAYIPYGVDPCHAGGHAVYVADPCYVDGTPGSYGNCAAGTCGGADGSSGACGGLGGCGGGGCGGGCGG